MDNNPLSANSTYRFTPTNNAPLTPTEQNIKTYKKGETLLSNIANSNFSGLVISGLIYLIGENANSERCIIDYFEKGDLLYQQSLLQLADNTFYVLAKTNCEINLVNLQSFNINPPNSENNLVNLLSKFERKRTTHTYILQQRKLRNKLLLYFKYLSHKHHKDNFILPLCYTDLADYLATDRSALMRELKKLNDDKLIKSEKRKITLLTTI